MSDAPPSKNRFSTSLSAWYSALPAGIWKLPEVPMPIAGIISPEDGMGRRNIPVSVAACAWVASQVAPDNIRKWRRVVMVTPCFPLRHQKPSRVHSPGRTGQLETAQDLLIRGGLQADVGELRGVGAQTQIGRAHV